MIYDRLKNYKKSVADFYKAVELVPNNAEFYLYRGIANSKAENFRQSLEDYNKAVELDPNNAAAYNSRGFNYFMAGEDDKALADLALLRFV